MKELFLLNKTIREFDDVIIYGFSAVGKSVLWKLLQHDVKILCFADSNPDICGQKYLNVPVTHINDLRGKESAAVVISVMHYRLVADELRKLGFNNLYLDLANESGAMYLDSSEDFK